MGNFRSWTALPLCFVFFTDGILELHRKSDFFSICFSCFVSIFSLGIVNNLYYSEFMYSMPIFCNNHLEKSVCLHVCKASESFQVLN